MAINSDHDFAVELGSILKHRREMLYVTQGELAEASGFHRSYIADVERGVRNLAVRNLRRICEALDIPVSVVFKQLEVSMANKKTDQKKQRKMPDKNI
ncbi:MAG: helix-turn-helix transcriptional regulator [Candidatus Melainabacteria bacterium]|nr:helix-turn-helix transcriptional regulator [Candidatus Melainabacteria bacterium]